MQTRSAWDKTKFSAFSLWLRDNKQIDSRIKRLDIQNLDYIVHGYGRTEAFLMLIEEKTHGGQFTKGQKETHGILDQVLREYDGLVNTMRGRKPLRYFGYHQLWFSGKGPLDSVIMWDDQEITVDELTLLIGFDLDPYTLAPRNEVAA